MSISCVSMSSVLCRVIILRVSVSVPCRGHPAINPDLANILGDLDFDFDRDKLFLEIFGTGTAMWEGRAL